MDQLLQNCLHRESSRFPFKELESAGTDEWDSFIRLAAEHRVDTVLFFNITNYLGSSGILMQDLSPEFRSSVDKLFKKTGIVTRYNLRLFAELQALLKRLKVEKIPVIVLKGAFLAHEVYPGLGMREMDDIDLMFRKDDLGRVYDIFEDIGFKPKTPFRKESISSRIKKKQNLVHVVRNDCTIEIHWNIVSPGQPCYIEPDGLWERAKKTKITSQPAMVFSEEDFLLHLCHNFSYHHVFGFGLRPVYDILALMEHPSVSLNWDKVIAQAASNGWQKGVWLSLCLAGHLFGAQVPEDVLNRLHSEHTGSAIVETAQKQLFADQEVLAVLRNLERISDKETLEEEDNTAEGDGIGGKFRDALKRFIKPEKRKPGEDKTSVSSGKEQLLDEASARLDELSEWLMSGKN